MGGTLCFVRAKFPVLLLLSIVAAGARANSTTITTDELEIVTRGSRIDRAVLIDVRNWVDYQDSHIPGAILIPLDDMAQRLPEKVSDRNRELIFYCGGPKCPLSRQAADAAKDLGYRHVRVYEEGLSAWQLANQKLVTSAPLPVIDPVFVSAQEVLPVIEKKKADTMIVDVRSRKEFAESHLKNSINIPLDELEEKEKKLSHKKVIFVCHAGGQSVIAARLLSKTGRKDMCVLRGGLVEWQRTQMPFLEGQNP